MRAATWTLSVGAALAACLVFLCAGSAVRSAEKENHCFTCHTNPRKLIEITRGIAKTDKDKPGASSETKGEG